MAKDKKRGFFSWLGFGQKEEEQQQPESAVEQAEQQAAETPAAPKLDDKLPTQGSAPAATKDTPGEWDSSLSGEPITENILPLDEHHAEPVAIEEVTVAQQPEAQVEEPELIEAPAEIIEPEPEVIEAVIEASAEIIEPEPEVIEAVIEAPAEIIEPEPEVIEAVIEASAEIIEPEPEVIEEVIEPELEAEPEQPELLAPAVTQEQERPSKEGFFARLKRSLLKTKQNLGSGFIGLFRGKKIDDDLFEELEEQLLIADVGVETTRKIIESLTLHASRKQLKDAESLYGKLKEEMAEILAKVDQPLDVGGKTPFVILMVGVNGVGKTTTIGKLARQFQAEGKSVMLAAGDTFRAAAVEQLQVWGERNRIPVIAQHTGADSASVIFDAVQAAKARNIDVLIADTAGRLQNKAHLMEELKKIVRVMKKLDEQAPHEVMLTLDASTGQNAVNQAKLFNEAVGLTGITLTKLDGTAKGGVIFSIADQFTIPIRYIGVGEGIEDLRPFKADDFIEALFARED
ncbi:signal recognition particle-docking protein FtsY [Serratia fonticola]|uniref:signal recognition particle-docking protein FtsY n=1 Tax=Serratia fonticola TaxID=47917 RepID=UPI001AE456BB|nr:signal recognition particle-docking protein FtsY [Serratia fonticola]MBP0999636.1 signal recognition particle-docking protein FtsY [Serratia fonticola]MBP1004719.1 signal recognition particle-docking protein FtsY [Serratia fonticola]MBP1014438.1 signal recognition particle-docking protein FtsY [Serratia fonticola]